MKIIARMNGKIAATATLFVANLIIAGTLQAASAINRNNGASNGCSSCRELTSVNYLAPVTPCEATFEDVSEMYFAGIAPVTPDAATFDDAPESGFALSASEFAPATPAEASFDDCTPEKPCIDVHRIAPVTPETADFD
jgi:hypothetical protein